MVNHFPLVWLHFQLCYFVIASGETAIEAQESAATNALEYLQMMIKWSETARSKMTKDLHGELEIKWSTTGDCLLFLWLLSSIIVIFVDVVVYTMYDIRVYYIYGVVFVICVLIWGPLISFQKTNIVSKGFHKSHHGRCWWAGGARRTCRKCLGSQGFWSVTELQRVMSRW